MSPKSLVPPESNTPQTQPRRQAGLLCPDVPSDYGQQLSSFTELKEGKKTGNLFTVSESPLKAQD